jgi:glycosyltransferase involved in cell wall biosynthesis
VVLDYPRLSETFIAQEILALEQRGLDVMIVALRRPPETVVSEITGRIRAPVLHLPKFPHREPLRVLRAWRAARRRPAYSRARRLFWRDFLRDPGPDRVLRFLQGLVLSHELPPHIGHLHAQFLYYPASVARYVSLLRDLPWSCAAHAIDIWTIPDWEKREKLADCRWVVTCTQVNLKHLRGLTDPGKVRAIYHGIDFGRFPPPGGNPKFRPPPGGNPNAAPPPPGGEIKKAEPPLTERGAKGREAPAPDGSRGDSPVVILSVGRVVEKKGYAQLLQALDGLPPEVNWTFVHIGAGILRDKLMRHARALGLEARMNWMGPQPPEVVLQQYRSAHVFALACRVAANGDRDGLPNVLLEAQSQALPVVSTTVSAIPELIEHGKGGLLCVPGDTDALGEALMRLIRDPALRERMGRAGQKRVREHFGAEAGIVVLAECFGLSPGGVAAGGTAQRRGE